MSSESRGGMTLPLAGQEILSPTVTVPTEKIGQAACELYAANSEAMPPAAELEVGEVAPLDGMRAWLRADTERRIIRGKVPEAYSKADLNINRIHQGDKCTNPHNPLPAHAPTRLLVNYIRYRERFDAIDPDEVTHDFLVKLYGAYVADAKAFSEHGVSKAEDVALHHGASTLAWLKTTYESHPFIGTGDINKAFVFNRKNPSAYLEKLEATVDLFRQVAEPALRAEYGYPGSWSQQFIKRLCGSIGPELLARRIFATMRELQTAYPRADPKNIERWVQEGVIDQGKKKAVITELLKEVPGITVSEQQLLYAASDLGKLRGALLAGHISPMSKVNSPAVQRLLRIADANWSRSFDELDLPKEARRIYFAVRDYNAKLKDQEDAIPIESEHLYTLLLRFAGDVAALKEEGPPSGASDVARFHAPGVYVFYRDKYKDLLPVALIDQTVSHWPMTIEAHIEQRSKNIDTLKAAFGTSLTAYQIRRFSYYKDGESKARACLAFMPEAQAAYPWVSRSDLAGMFYRSATPETDFEEWTEKVETIEALYPKDPRFRVFVRKRIARQDGNAVDIINNHLAKIKEVLDEHKGSPFIIPEFVAYWVALSPDGYKTLVKAHLVRVKEVERLFDQADEDVDYIALRYIAFRGDKPEEQVGKYIAIKRALELVYPEDDHIEQWMINQAAAFSTSAEFARAKLLTLRNMKRRGVFNIYSDRSSDGGRSLHEIMQDKAWQNLPENVVIYLESCAERRAQVETYLSHLSALDRLAVETVFGFVSDTDRTELQEELGVTNLERYVMHEVIPHLKLEVKE